MTRDPLAVARDLACLPRGARSAGRGLPPAMRCPCPLACDPLAVACLPPCLRSAIRWPRSAGRGVPAPAPCLRSACPLPAIRCPPRRDPPAPCLRSAARPGDIRWPIRRHPMADQATSAARPGDIRCPPRRHPMADQATSAGRPGDIRWPLKRDPMAAIRRPRPLPRVSGSPMAIEAKRTVSR